MSDLRAVLIEALARSRHERIRRRAEQKGIAGIVGWDEVKAKADLDDESDTYVIRLGEAAEDLDAVLDTLADTDDIPLYPSETGYRDVVYTTADGVTAAYLMAVLRGDE